MCSEPCSAAGVTVGRTSVRLVVDLNRIGNELTAIEDKLRAIFRA